MTVITVCQTCKFGPDEPVRDGRTAGEALTEHVEAAAAARPGVEVRRFSCLMGCTHHCNVSISAAGKLTYVLGSFEPTAEAAEAIADYAAKHAASDTGAVPYREWPQGVKGHFVARVPPL